MERVTAPPSQADPPVRPMMSVATSVAHVAVVASSVIETLAAPISTGLRVSASIAAVASLALGIPGLYWIERAGTRRLLHAYFAVQTLLGGFALFATQGGAALMLLALVSQAILYLGLWGSLAFAGGTLASVLLTLVMRADAAVVVRGFVSYGSAVAFVSMFSFMALRQRQARLATQRLAAELAQANDRLRENAVQIQELATTTERNRIAREIHDTLGHSLTIVHVQLDAARVLFESDPPGALAAVERAQRLTHEGLEEVRRSVSMLRGATLAGRTLLAALEKLVGDSCAAGLEARLEVAGAPRRLSAATEFTLYRAAQEALTNAQRHARASSVVASLDFGAAQGVALAIEDDGLGAERAGGGYGLVGLRERVLSLGGRVDIETSAGRGFRLRVEVPG
jgi:signal transduction histidine kinase